MKFQQQSNVDAVQSWVGSTDGRERACAHNLVFEERISKDRMDDFEISTPNPSSVDDLRRNLVDHYRRCTFFDKIPQAFTSINSVARLGDLSAEQKILRLENLREPLFKTGVPFAILEAALGKTDRLSENLFVWFCNEWNGRPDIRRNPLSFGAFKDENQAEYKNSNWPELFRNKLGLAHYDGVGGTIPVALMEYTAGEIIDQVRRQAQFAHSFAVPTSIDGEPYYQFFPTPLDMGFGAPMSLLALESPNDLVAEVLHPRLLYQPANIAKLGVIRSAVPATPLADLRNSQLIGLRLESSRDDFGEEF